MSSTQLAVALLLVVWFYAVVTPHLLLPPEDANYPDVKIPPTFTPEQQIDIYRVSDFNHRQALKLIDTMIFTLVGFYVAYRVGERIVNYGRRKGFQKN